MNNLFFFFYFATNLNAKYEQSTCKEKRRGGQDMHSKKRLQVIKVEVENKFPSNFCLNTSWNKENGIQLTQKLIESTKILLLLFLLLSSSSLIGNTDGFQLLWLCMSFALVGERQNRSLRIDCIYSATSEQLKHYESYGKWQSEHGRRLLKADEAGR